VWQGRGGAVRGSSIYDNQYRQAERKVLAVSDVEALIGVVNTEIAHTFTARFAVSPVRIGRKASNDLRLEHPAVGRRHGELSFGPGGISFRSLAWTKRSFVDGARIRRGVTLALTDAAMISIGPFKIEVCLRRLHTWRGARQKITPVRLSFPFGFSGPSGDEMPLGNDDPTVIVIEANPDETVDEELAEMARRLVPAPSSTRKHR
jgi:hypothetical protein